jgi:hypothetical protein
MKNILKTIFLSACLAFVMVGCDDETDIPYIDNPLFKESFDDNFTTWVKFSELGAQVWESAPFGNPDGFCAKMSGYSGSSNANIDWLISPAQDLSQFTNASFAFDNAYNFSGPVIEVYISNNYSGIGNPNAAGVIWKKINGAKLSTGGYSYKFSGILDISNYSGVGNESVYIAFKYTSTTSQSSTWEIDNFKVYGN